MPDLARNIRLKRVYDPPSPGDGRRMLITRYWPRGVPKSAVDEYTTKVAPSRELLREFKHEGLTWEEYAPRYFEEMKQPEAATEIERLAKLAKSEPITLMCTCEDQQRCHSSLLKELILQSQAASSRRHRS